MDEHTAHMRRALDAARLGPEADPNPRVGCVVTDASGVVVGVGHHRGAGTPHAEVDALRAAGAAARGGTAHVTLEPCDHTGRTGPCTEALLDAGVAAVRYAVADPGPGAGGALRLRDAGVDVGPGPLEEEAAELNRTWLAAVRTGRPFVTWKCATTLDGRSAAADGSSRWVTGPRARADVHALRARVGAVLVGSGTALADDPALTVRDADGRVAGRQPLRVVLGTRALPTGSRLLDDAAETLHLAHRDPHAALAAVRGRGVHHVLLEGGPTLAAAFLDAGLVDEVVAYVAPALLGAGAGVVGDLGIVRIDDALRLDTTDVAVLDGDVRIKATPRPSAPRS
ncbi:bifunctional diaminohydroxyphosphoribosylaminopyrimidine deaminase/5-amino-6-(5-phosphoribosylamino)uracil reductase RibD [Phycicoccus sp. BSK3Z-2]|uniref:Riboflavin biosynthesis protein RibD n=1 Tax=Phycicoccus avicenniae TaxID=2828860 RepID=A0A941D5A3_9MICO|nr:bifunctional diaminohydroxyphosphoribosylaminopyrimidine deaminase/5-amino-6-(5-phosphoribosylamino)uracil reductase RibD [Phycicoccus avicenniae]MBR7742150.1 bifunctional diaminohydroxyphosphoribosylaminopyrimidine deaminase/5-amino-6-(5-phosphoribosylamino)uracil reductase RibD [Phycicoccus avicenniae]